MADPFVQRMMARSQARRAGVLKNVEACSNKENQSLSDNTRSRLKHLNHMYTDTTSEEGHPLQPSNTQFTQSITSTSSKSPIKTSNTQLTQPIPSTSSRSPIKTSNTQLTQPIPNPSYKSPIKTSNTQLTQPIPNPSYKSPIKTSNLSASNLGLGDHQPVPHHDQSPDRPRLTALARRCQAIRDWDDDFTYHSSSHSSQVEVEGDGVDLQHASALCRTHTSTASHTVSQGESTSQSALVAPSVSQADAHGDGSMSVAGSSNKGEASEYVCMSASRDFTASSYSLPKSPSKSEMTRDKTLVPQRTESPTRKLAWDQGLISTLMVLNNDFQDILEAQGFTPSDSRSRLSYDFKKGRQNQSEATSPVRVSAASPEGGARPAPTSPAKVRGMSLAELVRSASPTKQCSSSPARQQLSAACLSATCLPSSCQPPPPPPPPVVVSCLPKSPPRRLATVPNRDTNLSQEQRPRDPSPSKVGEMRSRWEQHIRQASPERADRSRSPTKCSMAGSPTRTTTQPGSSSPSHPHSPSRQAERSGFLRGGAQRQSRRELSPHKPGPVGQVVKGQVAMPSPVPLVNEPFAASVRQRAAAFDGAAVQVPQRDPAELSVQERLALFSKKQGGALVPKAPFGQPVPAKVLHSAGGNHVQELGTSVASTAHSQPVKKPAKRVATQPSMAPTPQPQQHNTGNRSPSPIRADHQDYDSQRQLFENLQDNWRENDIHARVHTERQREMEVLLNRFKKPRSSTASRPPPGPAPLPPTGRGKFPEESESEYLESDESFGESTSSGDSLAPSNITGPPKPPRIFVPTDTSQHSKRGSPPARLNSTEIGEVRSSPRKPYVPKVKPGCLFPSLSDIESHSENPDSQESQDEEDVHGNSFSESVLTCTSLESLGQKIQRAAQGSMNKTLSMIAENTEASNHDQGQDFAMSESTMNALDAIDDALEEALADDPTPPKRHRTQDTMSHSVYKTPKISQSPGSYDHDQDSSLTHSISMYRKQKPEVTYTPVRQIIRRPDLQSPTPEPVSPSVTVSARIRELQEEIVEQERVIAQASNAVTVVLQRLEQQGTPQHIEAEKLLLLASQKRQAALNEIQRVKAEGVMSQHSVHADQDSCRGSISISNISVPLKSDFLQKGMKGEDIYHLIVLVKHREQVISSQLLTTPECVVEGAVTFPNLMALHHLTSDFNITLEVYALCTHKPQHHSIRKDQSRLKLTPLKRLHKHEARVASPAVQSPGGPFAVRSSSFQLVGFTHLNISTLTRNAWTLEKVPFSSPLDGHLLMHVSCSFEGGITERGFLTMFEDVGGYGAWNRRWCVLSGMFLRYWKYPDDENRKEPLGQLDLRSCTTRRVELVSRDICARQHTFLLTLVRPAHPRDISNLVQEVQGSTLVTKVMLSSDSKEERLVWCNKLTKSLANIRAWDPDAMRPEDYSV